jgi:hypothetical protein
MKTEDILDYCLKEIEAGRKTPAECVGLFPNVPGLEAQLRAAAALRRLEVLAPRPEASRQIEARLRQKLRARKPTTVRGSLSTLRWGMPLALITSLLFGMVGTVAASSDSVPGNALYPVKRASETVQVILTPDSEQASLHATLAQRRLDEIIALSQVGTVDLNLLTDLTTETETALNSVENTPTDEQGEVLSAMILLTERQQAVLTTVKASAPPQAQAGLDRAIAASSHNQGVAQSHLEQGPPSKAGPDSASTVEAHSTQIPPGQEKKTETAPDSPNCKANSPNSPNYCTPTPTPVSISATPSPTLCGTPNGKATRHPKCKATMTPCPAEKPGRGSKCK